MKQLLLLLGFVALLLLIGHGWQGEALNVTLPAGAGPSTATSASTSAP